MVRTIGLARATVKIGIANIAYNMRRAVWLTAARSESLKREPATVNRRTTPHMTPSQRAQQPHQSSHAPLNEGSWRCPAVLLKLRTMGSY